MACSVIRINERSTTKNRSFKKPNDNFSNVIFYVDPLGDVLITVMSHVKPAALSQRKMMQFPTEIIIKIISFCSYQDALKLERVNKRLFLISYVFEREIWAPKMMRFRNYKLSSETWKDLYRIYKTWDQYFPNLGDSTDKFLDPEEHISLSSRNPDYAIKNDWKLSRKLIGVRLGVGSSTLPIRQGDECQVWLDNSGQITRGLSIRIGEEGVVTKSLIIPDYRPREMQVQMIQQIRSGLLACQEISNDHERITLRIWDPKKLNKGPWNNDGSSTGIWVLENQAKGAVLCGDLLLTKFKRNPDGYFSSCRLNQMDSSVNTFKIMWECDVSESENIKDMALNETFALVKCFSPEEKHYKLHLLSVKDGRKIGDVPIPIYLNSDFRIALTRFHILLYNSSWLCIQEIESNKNTSRKIKLPYVGTPVRMDFSDDDSMIIIAPYCQKGEIIVVDIFEGKSKTVVLTDGFAEGAHWRGGGFAGRCSPLGVWMLFSDRFVDEKGQEKSSRRLHITWKDLIP